MDATDDRMEPRSISASAVFKQLTCAVCADLYVDPVLAPCSHSFCRTCITRAISVNQRCPLCRAEIPSPAMLHANLSLAALVGELRVACKYRRYGCASEVTLESKVAHESTCSYAPLLCHYAARGCKFSGSAGDLEAHLPQCPYYQLRGFLDTLEIRMETMQRQLSEQAAEISELRRVVGGRLPALGIADAATGSATGAAGMGGAAAAAGAVEALEPESAGLFDVQHFDCRAAMLNAHQSGITALCPWQVERDRFVLFSGSHDARIKMWRVDEGVFRLAGDIEAHRYTVWGLVRHGDAVYSASADGRILCWDVSNVHLKPRQPMTHDAKIYSLATHHDLLCSGSADKSIKVWDLRQSPASPVVATLNGHSGAVWSVKFASARNPASDLLSAGNCGNVNVWDARTWTSRHCFNFENNEALAVECTEDGAFVFVGSSTSKIFVFEAASGQVSHRCAAHSWDVWQLERLDNECLLSGSYDHKICVWSLDPRTGFQLNKTLGSHKGALHSLKTCGRVAFSGSGDKSIRMWA